MSVSFPCWSRVSNAVEDPLTKTSVAQDQVIQLTGEDGDWYTVKTLDEQFGRVPKILTNVIANPLRSQNEKVYCSIAQYDAQRDGDLSFGIFTILVSEAVSAEGWHTGVVVTDAGSVNGKTGIFPQSFVQIVVDLPGDVSSETENKRHSSAEEGIGFAIVRHDFTARQSDELSVKMGDSVRILKMVSTDWVSCKDPSTDASGIVPVTFLELYLDEDEEDGRDGPSTHTRPASMSEQSFSTLASGSFSAPLSIQDWRTSTRLEEPIQPLASAKTHEWATFGDDWNSTGEKKPPPARPPPPKTSLSPSEMVSVTEMFGMAEKQDAKTITATISNVNLNQEEKRSKVLEELINTELQFITDINAYTEAVDGSTRLSTKQKVIMKNGCAQVVELARALVQGLTNEQMKPVEQQMIGECFLRLRKSFASTYGYYFRNIDHINSLLMASKTDPKIETALRELVVRMRASGAGVFDASTAVSRPVQRCVKYPLFLSEIAKYTAITHPDHPKLLEAVKQLSHLGSKMNESKRRKELTRKYSEEQSNTSLGDKLSKFTVHSIKKKTNRFTYRMGSSLGVVKVTRDADFDRLVCELDQAERRLVRFNYMLVIYRKKMFYETRQLIQKRLIEPRKREIPGVSADAQTFPFHEMIKDLAIDLNSKVRDEIVKALRAIPKKLIRKRNDKLMDYEAAKSSNKVKSDFMSKFKDFEALNNQVKQTLPKVLRDAMKTVDELDSNLISRIRSKFQEEITAYQNDPLASSSRLIVPGMSCFANYYDPDRLKPLHNIVNKASKFVRLNSTNLAPSIQKNEGNSEVVAKADDWKSFGGESFPSAQNTAVHSLAEKKAFRAQTDEERSQILVKADLKNRRADIYRCMSEWPSTAEALELNRVSGKMLIVRPGDAVLAVRKDPCNMWLCYNGYYNALLPSTILTPWYGPDGIGGIELGIDAITLSNRVNPMLNRPHSTPPKQQSTNLIGMLYCCMIDLDDDLIGPTVGAGQPLTCTLAPLTPIPVGAAASMSSLEPELPAIDWGAPSNSQPQARAPSLPNLATQNSPVFPVTFDENASFTPGPTQLPPAPSRTHQNTAVTQANSNGQDAFTMMWEQIKNVPLSNITQRSESPQPVIPSRPAFESAVTAPSSTSFPMNSVQNQGGSFAIHRPAPAKPSFIADSSTAVAPSSALYSVPPQYDVVPGSNPISPTHASSSGNIYPVLYEEPPVESVYPNIPMYDTPPAENGKLPSIGKMTALFDFKPVGPNQLEITAGEKLDLIQAHDDGGNTEWIWVQRLNGEHGFVPAAYCKAV
ncbi:SH3 domain protein [Necator americanus]|uniref:SH3 domain protein n=1 Tax=Necator americanus TaxID=51031 RepID=W2T7N0_NECAM|nr:SH3 domain protein [Necator americanus]ETN77002.1 SH3 domain protein [Necator americanus]